MLHSPGPLQNKIRPARRRHAAIASKAEKFDQDRDDCRNSTGDGATDGYDTPK